MNDKDGIELYQMIYNSIYDEESPIQYIINEERNQEFKRDVNECFYLLLEGLCLSVTSKDIELVEITIKDYYNRLKEINNILQNLNHDLNMHLNELRIIDDLVKIIECELDKEIKNIGDIRKKLKKIQK